MKTYLMGTVAFLGMAGVAHAQCSGASGVPFNCTAGTSPSLTDLYLAGAETGGQSGHTVSYTATQLLSLFTANANTWSAGQTFNAGGVIGAGTTVTNAGTISGGTLAGSITNAGTIAGGTLGVSAGTITMGGNWTGEVGGSNFLFNGAIGLDPNNSGGFLMGAASANAAGNVIGIEAGFAGTGTNLNGGGLLLVPGNARGTGTADVKIYGVGGGSSGTASIGPTLVADFGYPSSAIGGAGQTLTLTGLANLVGTVSLNGHTKIIGGGTPIAATCGGTGTISGVDNAFDVTVGGTSTTTCTITPGNAFSSAPHVTVGLHTPAAGAVYVTTAGTASIVLTFATATTNGVVSVIAIPSS